MSLYDRLPEYMLGKFQLISTVVFTALFSLVLLLLSLPFTNNVWFGLSLMELFLVTLIFFVLSVLVVSLSKRLMYALKDRMMMTFLTYILWCFAEVVLIASLYTLSTVEGGRLGILKTGDLPVERLFAGSVLYLSLSLGIPYVIAGLYFAVNDKNNTIRLLNFGNVVSDLEPGPNRERMITLTDNNGLIKLSVSLSNLLFMESDDNYLKVWYQNSKGELKQYMLRCKLKTVEDSFAGSELVRCHRKYIVNITKVRLMTRDRGGYMLDLDEEEIDPIPVSRTYEETVLSKFNSR